jgi:diguanylate cyclase (GGDEF)-like protein
VFYVLAVLITGLLGGHFRSDPLVFWPVLVLITGVTGLRLAQPPAADSEAARQRWLKRHWLLVYACLFTWSAYAAWTLQGEGWRHAGLFALICSINFSTAIVHQFGPALREALTASLLGLGMVLGAILLWRPELHAAAIALAFYAVYLVSTGRNSAREYARHLDLEFALQRARIEVESQARIDALTGLSNRREFDDQLRQALSHARRSQSPLSLLLLDLDHFKQINDRYGHLVGDRCLAHVAARLRETCRRGSDVLARIGGEEFAVLMPGASLAEAGEQACRIRARIEGRPLDAEADEPIGLTASIGVTALAPDSDDDAEALLRRADDALYRAKRAGRNRVEVEDPPARPAETAPARR